MKIQEKLIRDILEFLNTDPEGQALIRDTWEEFQRDGRSKQEFELWKAGLVQHFYTQVALDNQEVFDAIFEDLMDQVEQDPQ